MLEQIKLAIKVVALINGTEEPRYAEIDMPYSVYNIISLLPYTVRPHINFQWYNKFDNMASLDELMAQLCANCVYKGTNKYIQLLVIKAFDKIITFLNRSDSPRNIMSQLLRMFPVISINEDEVMLSKRIPELINVYAAWSNAFASYYNVDRLNIIDGCMEIKFNPTFNRELEKAFNSILDITFKEIEKFIHKHTKSLIIKRVDSFAVIIPLY